MLKNSSPTGSTGGLAAVWFNEGGGVEEERKMRGYDRPQTTMLTLVNPEQRVPANHPIWLIKELAEVALKELSPLFEQMYSEVGRPSIPPERLLKVSLLMALYTVRSERMFCEQLDYNLLFRWFLDLNWLLRTETRQSPDLRSTRWSDRSSR